MDNFDAYFARLRQHIKHYNINVKKDDRHVEMWVTNVSLSMHAQTKNK